MNAPRLHHGCNFSAPVLDHAGFRGGSSHVERNHVLLASEITEQRGRETTAGRAGFKQADREGACSRGGDEAARRVHQAQGAHKSARCQFAFQPGDVAVHQGLNICIGAGGHAALVLPKFGDHLV